MKELTKEMPPIGEKVLCWFEERKEWVIDEARELSKSDGGGVCFWNNYAHNYTHWEELPPNP
jgi:hypothetical protein